MECQCHNTFVPLYSCINNNIAWKILVRIEWIKYIINIEMHFVGHLYITDLITTCISVKHTCASFLSMLMCLWCDCRSLNQNSGSVKGLSECQLFYSLCWLTVNCEVSDCLLVNCCIVCFFMCCCASASAVRSRHKQYEVCEMKVRMFVNIIQCWPSGM